MIRFTPLVLTLSLLTASAAACGDGPVATHTACGVVIDSTRFAAYAPAAQLVTQNIRKIKSSCDRVAFAAVTGNSEGTPCSRPTVRLLASREENPNDNPKIAERIRKAREPEVDKHVKYLLHCKNDGSKGSDILGALRVIDNSFTDAPAGQRRQLTVFSDMMNNIGALNLNKGNYQTATARKRKIKKLSEQNLLPNLSGVSVTILGFNLLSERDPDRVPQLRLFWQDLLKECGAVQVEIS